VKVTWLQNKNLEPTVEESKNDYFNLLLYRLLVIPFAHSTSLAISPYLENEYNFFHNP
jgi:hypothetical protein